MIRQCCVCKRIFENGEWVYSSSDLELEEITHGYCEVCYEDFMRTVSEYLSVTRGEPAMASRAA